MKKLLVTLCGLVAVANVACAANDNPTVTTETVNYKCQLKKTIKVKYGFNKEGLPTYAEARLDGKVRKMPINLDISDDVDTYFGTEKTYSLSAEYINKKNLHQKSIMITAPSQQILFKECIAR